MEKVLIEVREPFKVYDINLPELQKLVEKFQGGNISSQSFNWNKITYYSAWPKTSNRR